MVSEISIDAAMRALAEAKTPIEFVSLATTAETLRHYAIRAGLGLAAQNTCAELRLRAECALGLILAQHEMRGRPKKGSPEEPFPRLASLGISKRLSSRSQRLAAISVEVFDSYIADTIARDEELTTRGMFLAAETPETHGGTTGYLIVPPKLYAALDRLFHFDFDPCPSDPAFDGLTVPWGMSNWVNIPFVGGVMAWINKAIAEWQAGKDVVLILPTYQSRAITALEKAGGEIIACGSVAFLSVADGSPNPDPSPCVLVVLRWRRTRDPVVGVCMAWPEPPTVAELEPSIDAEAIGAITKHFVVLPLCS